jgi:hypothetical protein
MLHTHKLLSFSSLIILPLALIEMSLGGSPELLQIWSLHNCNCKIWKEITYDSTRSILICQLLMWKLRRWLLSKQWFAKVAYQIEEQKECCKSFITKSFNKSRKKLWLIGLIYPKGLIFGGQSKFSSKLVKCFEKT